MTEALERQEQSKRRRKAVVGWGAVIGIGALLTTAAFTDVEWGSLGSGIGNADSRYNLQIKDVANDTWQDNTAETTAEIITLADAENMFPGSGPVSGTVEVWNDSTFVSTLNLALVDDTTTPSDVDFLAALRFTVTQDGSAVGGTYTYAELASGITLANLAQDDGTADSGPDQTALVITVELPDQGSAAANNALQGQAAQVLVKVDGESV
ncbi:hypothetical protein ACH436_15000 [Isoptericola sp. NPDC019693]|uniref:hypothetical protein n=1 Tax=Isoptericola sp. NPDC019693 TaxID=3364009 RepID=UPI00378E690C